MMRLWQVIMDDQNPYGPPATEFLRAPSTVNVHHWRGRTIEVSASASLTGFLWLDIPFTVTIDGDERYVQRVFRLSDDFRFSIEHEGAMVPVALTRLPRFVISQINYRLVVDHEVVAESTVKVRNWWIGVTIMVVMLAPFVFVAAYEIWRRYSFY